MDKSLRMTILWLLIGLLGILIIVFLNLDSFSQNQVGSELTTGTATLPVTATALPSATRTPKPTSTSTPTVTPTIVLPPDPIEVTFQAQDGRELSGLYYPAQKNPAPVIVLFHWARGDQQDWQVIAAWIQDRGLSVDTNPSVPWLDPSWFPERSAQPAVGVFTFSFRECEDSCQQYLVQDWLYDAQAAITAVTEIHGVDSEAILTIGAQIGADGAVDSCEWLNNTDLGRCRGALAISPGSYLTVPFDKAALTLLQDSQTVKVLCAFARRDDGAWESCSTIPEPMQVDYGYVDFHGMEIFQKKWDPNILMIVDQFIGESLP